MTAIAARHSTDAGIHPVHGLILAGAFPLYLGAALSDYAYAATYQIQWSIFASWLLAGGLVFNGLALLFALVELFRSAHRARGLLYLGLLFASWVLGFIGSLVHARDVWAMMPTGFVLSIVVAVLSGVAVLLRLSAGNRSAQHAPASRGKA